jgi:hypothetical protein
VEEGDRGGVALLARESRQLRVAAALQQAVEVDGADANQPHHDLDRIEAGRHD